MITEAKYKKAQKIVIQYKNKVDLEEQKELGQWIDDNMGKTFVYRNNSYGGDSPKWDVFKIIIEKKNNTTAIIQKWELINSREKHFEITQSEHYLYSWNKDEKNLDGSTPCSLKEFENNKKKIMNLLTKEIQN